MPAQQVLDIEDLRVWLGLQWAAGDVVDVHFAVVPAELCLQVEVLDVKLVNCCGWCVSMTDSSGSTAHAVCADSA